MGQIFVTTFPDGKVGIIHLAEERVHDRADFADDESFEIALAFEARKQAQRLPKTMFELCRTGDTGHFDPLLHTLDTIAAGLPGHDPLSCVEMDDEIDLPADRKDRDNWEVFEGKVRVKPA